MTRDAEHIPSPQSVVVPVEPTIPMLNAGWSAVIPQGIDPEELELDVVWSAMLAAAPAPSSLAGGEVTEALDQELIDRGLRTVRAYDAVRFLRDALSATTARLTGYDWNADPERLTKQQGDAFALADKVFADLTAAVDAHPDTELPECKTCGGTGKIEEAARTQGANQHSACVRPCGDCDGCGFAPDEDPAILAALSPEAPARVPGWPEGMTYGALDDVRSGRGLPPLTPRHEASSDTVTISRAEYETLKSGYPGDPSFLPEAEGEDMKARPVDLAPLDGTMLRLLVRYDVDNGLEAWTPLQDEEESWTVGFNNSDNTGEDRWQFVGWDWNHDCLLEAPGGTVIGWLSFHGEQAPVSEGEWTYHERAIAEQVDDEESGFWRPCSGCQEGVDGYVSEKDYPYSKTFRCQPGGGCSECGGLGVLWDNADYDQMAREIIAEEAIFPRHEAPASEGDAS